MDDKTNEKAIEFMQLLNNKLKNLEVKTDIDLAQPSQTQESALIRATRDPANYKQAQQILKTQNKLNLDQIVIKNIDLICEETLNDLFSE